jgi:cytidine deaminase
VSRDPRLPDGHGTLPPPEDLVAAARSAWRNAYAPYSRFHVGAALRGVDGVVYAGANVENASYGLGRCAEQSAVQAMATAGERAFTELVVFTASAPPASPCGACRQVLFEFAPDAVVWLVGDRGDVRATTVRALLPDGFSLRDGAGAPPA